MPKNEGCRLCFTFVFSFTGPTNMHADDVVGDALLGRVIGIFQKPARLLALRSMNNACNLSCQMPKGRHIRAKDMHSYRIQGSQ